jgi:hypothetical protein
VIKKSSVMIPQPGGWGSSKQYDFTFSPELISGLDTLRDMFPNLELVWCSTWNDGNNILMLPKKLGGLFFGRILPCFLPDVSTNDPELWSKWKGEAIIEDQRVDPTPFIWVDDVAVLYHKKVVEETVNNDMPKLFIQPVEKLGVTKKDLVTMNNFMSNLA